MSENKFSFNEAEDVGQEIEAASQEPSLWQEIAANLYSDMRPAVAAGSENTRFLLAGGTDSLDAKQLPSFQGTTAQLKVILQQLA